MRTTHVSVAGLPAVGLLCWMPTAAAADGPYRQLKEIAIGGEGGWDYLSVDTAARRLYVSHATKVVVVDIDKDAVVGEIAPAPGVHGIALAARPRPRLREQRPRVHGQHRRPEDAADRRHGQDRREPGRDPVRAGAQGGLHLQRAGKSATVFDAKTGEVRATIPLPGKPEFAVFDEKAGRIYNNIEDTNQLVAIDPATHAVVATWPIAPGEEASGLALDPATHRLFVGCSNNLMLMVDAATGKVLASVPIGPGVDANAFDPGTGLAFASSGDGTLTVARSEGEGSCGRPDPRHAYRSRTMALDRRRIACMSRRRSLARRARPRRQTGSVRRWGPAVQVVVDETGGSGR